MSGNITILHFTLTVVNGSIMSMNTAKLRDECRALIAFYDEKGWDWTSALAFTLTRDLFGSRMRVHPVEGYRCYLYPKVRTNGEPANVE